MIRSQRYFLSILLLNFFTSFLYAGTISFKSDTMTGNAGENRRNTTLTGHAWVQTEDMEIKADIIDLTGKDYDTVTATGNVWGTHSSSGFTFTCNSLIYERKTGIVKLQGEVSLTDVENGVTAQAHFMKYDQHSETAQMQINVKLVQNDAVCTCALALYRKKDRLLEMSGSPQVIRGKDVFKAQEILFNLRTEEIVLDGRVRGTVQNDAKDSNNE